MSDDILGEFLKECDGMEYTIPLAVLEKDIDTDYPYDGIEIALFVYWSSEKNLLIEQVQKVIALFKDALIPLKHETLLEMLRNTIGNQLLPEHYNDTGINFVIDYVSFTGGKHKFWDDLEELYPDLRNYSDIPETQEEYEKIFSLFDERYTQYLSDKAEQKD